MPDRAVQTDSIAMFPSWFSIRRRSHGSTGLLMHPRFKRPRNPKRAKAILEALHKARSTLEASEKAPIYIKSMEEAKESVQEKAVSTDIIGKMDKDAGFAEEERKGYFTSVEGKSDSTDVEKIGDIKIIGKIDESAFIMRKRNGHKNLLSMKEKKIRFGMKLIRQRKNASKWRYRIGYEADCTVEKCFVDDEDEPEDNGEVMWDSEDEEYIYFPSIWRSVIDDEFSSGAPRYECFDDSGRRGYCIHLIKDRSVKIDHIDLLQKALGWDKAQVEGIYNYCYAFSFTIYATEKEADAVAGQQGVELVKPCFGGWG